MVLTPVREFDTSNILWVSKCQLPPASQTATEPFEFVDIWNQTKHTSFCWRIWYFRPASLRRHISGLGNDTYFAPFWAITTQFLKLNYSEWMWTKRWTILLSYLHILFNKSAALRNDESIVANMSTLVASCHARSKFDDKKLLLQHYRTLYHLNKLVTCFASRWNSWLGYWIE